MKKKTLSLILSLSMIVSLLPVTIYAENDVESELPGDIVEEQLPDVAEERLDDAAVTDDVELAEESAEKGGFLKTLLGSILPAGGTSTAWAELGKAMSGKAFEPNDSFTVTDTANVRTIVLNEDIRAGESDTELKVSGTVTLDLNGHTLDRGLSEAASAAADGSVLYVSTFAELKLQGKGTITGGNADQGGGVMITNGGTFNMYGGSIVGNRAYTGGGVCADGSGITVNISQDAHIENNIADSSGYSNDTASAYIDHVGCGGGLYMTDDGPSLFGNCNKLTFCTYYTYNYIIYNSDIIISGNRAEYGGGIAVYGGSWTDGKEEKQDRTTSVSFSGYGGKRIKITGNTASSSYGGGVYLNGVRTTMEDCSISGNSCGGTLGYGGGVLVSGGLLTANDNEITDNSATYGGGMSVQFGGEVTWSGGTISGNDCPNHRYGCGIHVINDDNVILKLKDCTVQDNIRALGPVVVCGPAKVTELWLGGQNLVSFEGTSSAFSGASIGIYADYLTYPDGCCISKDASYAKYFHPLLGNGSIYKKNGALWYKYVPSAWMKLGWALQGEDVSSPYFEMKTSPDGTMNVKLLQSVIASADDAAIEIPEDTKVVIDLNGCRLDRNLSMVSSTVKSDHAIVMKEDGAELRLCDTSNAGSGVVTGGNAELGGGVYVGEGNSLRLTSGAIAGNSGKNGGGVYVASGASFTMSGGSIGGNAADSGDGMTVCGSFTMYGGSIDGNEVYIADDDSACALLGGDIRISKLHLTAEDQLALNDGAPLESGAAIGIWAEYDRKDTVTYPKGFCAALSGITEEDAVHFTAAEADALLAREEDGSLWFRYGQGVQSTWSKLCEAVQGQSVSSDDFSVSQNGSVLVVTLENNITAGTYDSPITIPNGAEVELELNGYTLDRNLSSAEASPEDGRAIFVSDGASLTVKDSTGSGKVTGGSGIYAAPEACLTVLGSSVSAQTISAIDAAGSVTLGGFVYIGELNMEAEAEGKLFISGETPLDTRSAIAVAAEYDRESHPDGFCLAVSGVTAAVAARFRAANITSGKVFTGENGSLWFRSRKSDWALLNVAMKGETAASSAFTTYLSEDGKTTVIVLNRDITAEDGDTALSLLLDDIILDLNGHTLDRGFSAATEPREDGHVISCDSFLTHLTVRDSVGGGKITGGYAIDGGGIYLSGVATWLTLEGGSIEGNRAENHGSGVYVDYDSYLYMYGGRVTGGEVYLASGTGDYDYASVRLYDTAVIECLHLAEKSQIYLYDLEEGADIGVFADDKDPETEGYSDQLQIGRYYGSDEKTDRSVEYFHAVHPDGSPDPDTEIFQLGDYIYLGPAPTWRMLNAVMSGEDATVGERDGFTVELSETGEKKITLTDDIRAFSADTCLTVSGSVTLDLNGHTLDRGLSSESEVTEGGNVITVSGSGNSLTMMDSVGGGKLTGGSTVGMSSYMGNACGCAVDVKQYGSFTMLGGTITGNSARFGSVCVGYDGSFVMNDGSIVNNAGDGVDVSSSRGSFLMNGGSIANNTGRGVYIYYGSFTMNDGSIANNTGRGVYVYDGIFTMNDGSIENNTASGSGGGVYVDGSFTMNDGRIENNTASGNGGGVHASSFIMNGGSIENNTASNSGGGVDTGNFTMAGGSIENNTASNSGGGVYASGNFTMAGGVITRNRAYSGGGVRVCDTFLMQDGTISENSAEIADAVYIFGEESDKSFRMLGGKAEGEVYATDDTTVTLGGTVYVEKLRLTVPDQLFVGTEMPLDAPSYVGICANYDAEDTERYPDGSFLVTSSGINRENRECFFSADDNGELRRVGEELWFAYLSGSADWVELGKAMKRQSDTGSAAFTVSDEQMGDVSVRTVTLQRNITAPENADCLRVAGSVILDLNGHTLDRGLVKGSDEIDDYVLEISSDDSLTLVDSVGGGKLTGGGGGVYVDGGSFTMDGGSIANNDGCGVYIASDGSFTMNDGSIADNTGRGVYIASGGSFTMDGGSITGNNSNSYHGAGGVAIDGTGSSFVMKNGSIADNYGPYYGGVQLLGTGCSFTMLGGSITGNTTAPDAPSIFTTYRFSSGGVYVGEQNKFVMKDGVIADNMAYDSGGVYIAANAAFVMEGGSIEGNGAAAGGGVYNTGVFTMRGDSRIEGNITTGAAGGVYNYKGTFTLEAGSISANFGVYGGGVYNTGVFTMRGGCLADNRTYVDGGGVYNGSTGIFRLEGGSITGNSAAEANLDYLNMTEANRKRVTALIAAYGDLLGHSGLGIGGGVYNTGAAFVMSGGSISGNRCDTDGDNVYLSSGPMEMNGGSITDGELYVNALSGGAALTLGGSVRIDKLHLNAEDSVLLDEFIPLESTSSVSVSFSMDAISLLQLQSDALVEALEEALGTEAADALLSTSVLAFESEQEYLEFLNELIAPFIVMPSVRISAAGMREEYEPCFRSAVSGYMTSRRGEELWFEPVPESDDWTELEKAISREEFTEREAFTVTDELVDGAPVRTITLNGSISAGLDNTCLQPEGKVVLDLNGHILNRNLFGNETGSADGSAIYLNGAGNELTLRDSSADSLGRLVGGSAEQGGGVYVGEGSALTLLSGIICFNSAEQGGGVYVGENGALTMSSGSIWSNSAEQGGNVYVGEGGMFTMLGGSVIKGEVYTAAAEGPAVTLGGEITLEELHITGKDAVCFSTETVLEEDSVIGVLADCDENIDFVGLRIAASGTEEGYEDCFCSADPTGEVFRKEHELWFGYKRSPWAKLCAAAQGKTVSTTSFDVVKKDGVTFVTLLEDITAEEGDSTLAVGEGMSLVIEMNGYTLDRGLQTGTLSSEGGTAISVSGIGAELTLQNSSTESDSYLRGGNGLLAGGIYVGPYGSVTANNIGLEDCSSEFEDGAGVYIDAHGTFTQIGGYTVPSVWIAPEAEPLTLGGEVEILKLCMTAPDQLRFSELVPFDPENAYVNVFATENETLRTQGMRILPFGADESREDQYLECFSAADVSVQGGIYSAQGGRHYYVSQNGAELWLKNRYDDWSALGESMNGNYVYTPAFGCAYLDDGTAVITLYDDISADVNSGSNLLLTSGKKAILDLNGHTLDRALSAEMTEFRTDGEVFFIEDGAALTLRDSVGTGKITGANTGRADESAAALSGAVCVYGSFAMEGGTVTGNFSNQSGDGVIVQKGGSFTMTGGTLAGDELYVTGEAGPITLGGEISVETLHLTAVDQIAFSDTVALAPNSRIGVYAEYDGEVYPDGLRIAESGTTEGYKQCFNSLVPYSNMVRADDELWVKNLGAWELLSKAVQGEDVHDRAFTVSTAENGLITVTLNDDISALAYDTAIVIPDGKNIVLDLNGHTLDRALAEQEPEENGNVITVSKGAMLMLADSSEEKNGTLTGACEYGVIVLDGVFILSGGSITGNAGGVSVTDGGNLFMSGGSIADNAAEYGGGVCIDNGEFRMSGGSIADNTAENGGAVYVGRPGGIGEEAVSCSFTMSGGSIEGNTAKLGGGVYLTEGNTFTMTDGSVDGNTADLGGGVYLAENTTFVVDGGSIENNTAAVSGGAVYVGGGEMRMSDGDIVDNGAALCGGIMLNGTLTMTGGEISRNTADEDDGKSVYVDSGTMSMTGGSITDGEVFADEDAELIQLGGGITLETLHLVTQERVVISKAYPLTEDAEIGVWAEYNAEETGTYPYGWFCIAPFGVSPEEEDAFHSALADGSSVWSSKSKLWYGVRLPYVHGSDFSYQTGGSAFTWEMIVDLAELEAFNGTNVVTLDGSMLNAAEFAALNAAKQSGKKGEYPLTVTVAGAGSTVITVTLTDDVPEGGFISALNFRLATGGEALDETDVLTMAGVEAKAPDGETIPYEGIFVAEGLDELNEAKTAGEYGSTYTLVVACIDYPELSVEVHVMLEDLRCLYDWNNNGRIDSDDISIMIAIHGNLTSTDDENEWDAWMRILDGNDDGFISSVDASEAVAMCGELLDKVYVQIPNEYLLYYC